MSELHDLRAQEVLRYLNQELSPAEQKQFRQRLREDPELNAQLQEMEETLRQTTLWLSAEAPGIERLHDIPIPCLHPQTQWFSWRQAATAAIFLIGFMLGTITESQIPLWGSSQPIIQIATQTETILDSSVIPTEADSPTPEPTSPPPVQENETKQLAYSPTEYTREENGTVIIETELRQTGAQAIWVIDSNFQLQDKNIQ